MIDASANAFDHDSGPCTCVLCRLLAIVGVFLVGAVQLSAITVSAQLQRTSGEAGRPGHKRKIFFVVAVSENMEF